MHKRYLIPKFNFGGHYLEYITHIYTYAKQDSLNDYVFALSEEYKNYFNTEKNVVVFFMSEGSLKYYRKAKGIYMRDLFENILIRQLVKKYYITNVLHIAIVEIQRFLPFFSIKGVSYSGILYYVYLYKWKELSYFRKIQEVVIHRSLVKNKNIGGLFVCNDEVASRKLNFLFRTNKFKYLPDPYVLLKNYSDASYNEFSLDGKTVYIHLGALSLNKGTLEILKAIEILDEKIARNCVFVFAGKVSLQIKDEFYKLIDQIKPKTTIIVHDEFSPFSYIDYLFRNADFLLMPYMTAYQSSGMFGYASQYGVPVIANGKYIHKRLVKTYKLGYLLNEINCQEIANFISDTKSNVYKVPDDYIRCHSSKAFCLTLLNAN